MTATPRGQHEPGGIRQTLLDPERRAWVNGVWRDFAAEHPDDVSLVDADPLLCPDGDPRPTVDGQPLRRPDGTRSEVGVQATWEWLTGVAAPT